MTDDIDRGKRSPGAVALLLVAVLAILFGLLVGAGMLVSGPEANTEVESVDGQVTTWFAQHRVASLAAPSQWLSDLGSTGVVVGIGVVAAASAGLLLRRWWPVRLLAAALAGELLLFLVVSTIIDRGRPPVAHLDDNLPPTSSFPSGHTAASVCLYGGIAAGVCLAVRSWWRWAVVLAAVVIVLGVATARLYRGAHWATDVLTSVLFASLWLWVCVRSLAPSPAERAGDRARATGGQT